MATTHVQHHPVVKQWPRPKTQPAVKKAPRRKVERNWTRAFFHGEPRPWHPGMVVFGALVLLFYFVVALGLPTLLLGLPG